MAIIATRNLGLLFLAIWLIITSLAQFMPATIPGVITSILALIAGILLLLGR